MFAKLDRYYRWWLLGQSLDAMVFVEDLLGWTLPI